MVVPDGATYLAYSYDEDGYTIIARPPQKTDVPLPSDTPESIELDGKAGFAANAIQFDFIRSEFDRRRERAQPDPPVALMQRAVESLIARMRYVARAAQIEPLDFVKETIWSLEYLNDDGSELSEDPDLVRRLRGRHWTWSVVAVTPGIWDRMHELEKDWKSPVWDDILLDATNALPRIGTAVVLGATALEVFVADVLNRLASTGTIPVDIWKWINDRENWLKDPSTDEQFDALLKHFTGHSLKENSDLWQGFKELRTARNKFVHEGRALVGGREVDRIKAAELLANAAKTIDLVRGWVPAEHQWIVFNEKVELRIVTQLLGPVSGPQPQ